MNQHKAGDKGAEIGPIEVGDLVHVTRWFEPHSTGQEAYIVGFVRNYDPNENNPPILAIVAHERWIGTGVGPRELELISKGHRDIAERLRSRYEDHNPGQLLPTMIMPAPFELAQDGPSPIVARLKKQRGETSGE
jgi:hypothetical protein